MVTATNCCCTHSTCQPNTQHLIMGLLPMPQQPTRDAHHVLEALALCPSPSYQHHSPLIMSISSTLSNCHQPTCISPYTQPAPTSPMFCTAYHYHKQPSTALHISHQAHIRSNLFTKPSCHALPRRVSTTCCCPSSTNRCCPPWPSSAMALGHHVKQGASTCCPSSCSSN